MPWPYAGLRPPTAGFRDENSDEKQAADTDYSGSAASAGGTAKSSMEKIKFKYLLFKGVIQRGSNSNVTSNVVNPITELHILWAFENLPLSDLK